MIVWLTIAGPDVALLVTHLSENYGWAFKEFEQTSTMSGYAVGWHDYPEQFVGIGISDGTYVKSVELVLDE